MSNSERDPEAKGGSRSEAIVPTRTSAARGASPAGEPFHLVVVAGPDQGLSRELTPGVYRVGKGPDSQIALSDPEVSRNHLVLAVAEDGVHVRDLGSKNGSFLAGVRLTEGVLFPGSDLRVGGTRLRLSTQPFAPPRPPSKATRFGDLYGWSLRMREVFSVLEQVAVTDAHVLIEAETGCGKELCAQAIHAQSKRKKGPLVVCDLASVSRTLIDSELFGHVKGAFTGATDATLGAFLASHGGTLFIDELGELDLELQPRLLRALESREVKAVGSNTYRAVDFRVVAATNRNLEEEVAAGRFRQDLFYRLAVVRVRLPPLRERKEDIPRLVELFVQGQDVTIPPESLALLESYDWPGNVRELRNAIERGLAGLTGRGDRVLTPQLLGLDAGQADLPWPAVGEKDFVTARDKLIAAWERNYLEQLVRRCGGNVSRAAREGGIERVYLHRLLKRHNLSSRSMK